MDCNSIKINGYQIKEVLGHGGMATVYLAIQESFDRKVAIKIMAEQLSSDASFKDRFLQEAKIVSRLIHPNIVTVYDVSVVNNHHYLSMEYIEGVDLKEKLHTISLFHLIKVIKEVALALDYAGRKGYVHRDIKPENIMINNEDGRAVLMDFGIAKAFDSISEMTQTGTAIGTPYYMSPEQAKGKEVDWRSDIYSLGVVFFQVLTGQLPYQGDSAVSVGIMHLTDPIPPLPEYLQDVFQPIIEKLMAKSPEDRYQNGEDIIKALNNISDDDLNKINEQYTQDGHRDSGEHVNYNVSTPISNSGTTSVRNYTNTRNEQDDETKIVNIAPQATKKKPTAIIWAIAIAAVVVVGIAAFTYFSPKNDEKLNALIESTKLIEQQLIDAKKKEADNLLAKKAQETKEAQEAKAAEEAQANQIQERLQGLLKKADIQEQQLSNNPDTIDELYQTYQLISLLENEHPKVVNGYKTIQNTYLDLIEEHILNNELKLATNKLNKMLRSFPDIENDTQIVSIKDKIATISNISLLLEQAGNHLANNTLSGTNEVNAHSLYKKVLAISPNNKEAKEGIINISDKYYQNINQLIKEKRYKEALSSVDIAENIHAESSSKFTALRKKIESHLDENAQVQKKLEEIKQLLLAASIQKENGNLVTPKGDNALSIYQQVLQIDSSNQEAVLEIAELENLLLRNVSAHITAKNFSKAQEEIDFTIQYFPTSAEALNQQLALNTAIKKLADAQKPKITKVIVKGTEFADMSTSAIPKLKAERTIYIGFEFSTFGDKTNVLQAILYAGSISDKLSTTAVILSQDKGVKYFKISRPVAGFSEGGYFIDFMLKNEKVSSYKFSIEN
ncbi:protein kinase [Colwellia sp. MSW7]|uniref:Protein kinase n=1 Tax=Colwellia maritima TaxID=2912588 RepID=A0ABS9WZX0_9GAMM|nr:serine/threonine-protein kinase [Colwellia maritima]MCI2283449.1 protein kinase [Colwellia maritima]